MGVTNEGRDALALLMVGSGDIPRFMAVGSGSGTFAVTQTGLTHERSGVQRVDFSNRDIGSSQFVIFTHDISSIAMSGTLLTEFGLFESGANLAGSMWQRETFPSITFDGTNELQVELKLEVF